MSGPRNAPHVLPLALLALSAFALVPGEDLPLGHPDFYPSPERPVGWRGDGNGAFPGASITPNFGDGPYTKGKITIPNRHQKGKTKTTTLAYAAKGGPINIAWKFELPGFTYSQPIIVGDRAIQTCEPRTILCLDMKTGKKIWSRELCPFDLRGLSGKELDAGRMHESLAWTLSALRFSKMGNYTRLSGSPAEQWAKATAIVDKMTKAMDYAEPLLSSALQDGRKNLAAAKAILEAGPSDDKGVAKNLVKSIVQVSTSLVHSFQKRYGFPSAAHWYSYVGWAWPTPVCDGTWLYVHMTQGQVARLSLQDGSVSWIRSLSEQTPATKQPQPRSPILHKGLLYILARNALHALDAESGKEVWRLATHYDRRKDIKKLAVPVVETSAVGLRVMTLSSGRSILAVGSTEVGKAQFQLLDPATGKALFLSEKWDLPRVEQGSSLMSDGAILMYCYGGKAFRIIEDGDQLRSETLWSYQGKKKGWSANVQIVHDGIYFSSHSGRSMLNLFDLTTGKAKLSQGLEGFILSCYRPGILVGDHLISLTSSNGPNTQVRKGQLVMPQQFQVCDRAGTKIISRNILQVMGPQDAGNPLKAPQAAPFIGSVVKPSDIQSQCIGLPPTGGWAGMYAHGNRLLIPTTQHLYCIGDPKQPYNGTAP